MVEYYIERNGKRFGPATQQELVASANEGKVYASDGIIEGDKKPQRADSVKGLNVIFPPCRQGNLLVVLDVKGMPLRCVMTGEDITLREMKERRFFYHSWGSWATIIKFVLEVIGILAGENFRSKHKIIELRIGTSRAYRRTVRVARFRLWAFLVVLSTISVAGVSANWILGLTCTCIIIPFWGWLEGAYFRSSWGRAGKKWRAMMVILPLLVIAICFEPTSSYTAAVRSEFNFALEQAYLVCHWLVPFCYLVLILKSLSPFPVLQIIEFNESRVVIKGVGLPFLETLEEMTAAERTG